MYVGIRFRTGFGRAEVKVFHEINDKLSQVNVC